MDNLDRQIINRLQKNLPICTRPFEQVAQELGTTEDKLISRIQALLDDGTLTRFGPLFNAVELGGELSLCAMSIPEQAFDSVADLVGDFPQVAHNYARNHTLNMWFVLATSYPGELEKTLKAIEIKTGYTVYNFPKKKEFFIGLYLNV